MLTNEPEREPADSTSSEPLYVVIAYDDLPAYRRAVRVLVNIGRELQGTPDLRPLPWRFDVLASPDWRAHAAGDVARAEIVLISTSARDSLPSSVRTWLASCCTSKRHSSTLIVALPGAPGDPVASDGSAVVFLRDVAEGAGLAFLALERAGAVAASPSPQTPRPAA